ncbi:hypothetical protein TR74_05160 [Carbonactinospora thermoautotrophica]|uniref:Plasmid pRiA4b Orf3-like domain-containing protein n=1 Tax=Carbonactinospora thermoautotrophica TaxID=1469144 RepID=A0A132NJB0_9ACTN|nr:hypothetical protein [Carbonactinospora thermoautotrophica]KWX10184.1 hypothetical protein TR74_05160 [Carbonactinospora thermoautotrophica]
MSTDDLEALLERDRRMLAASRAPSVRRGPRTPGAAVVVLVDLGYRDPDCSFTVVVGPDHTFRDLAVVIDQVMERDDPHLAEFRIPDDRRLRNVWAFGMWDREWRGTRAVLPPGYWERTRLTSRDREDLGLDEYRRPWIDGCREKVTAHLTVGEACAYLFDFGDEWWHAIRVIRPAHPAEPTGGPLPVVSTPLRVPPRPSTSTPRTRSSDGAAALSRAVRITAVFRRHRGRRAASRRRAPPAP